jgi:superfamily II DNA or RNA helicase
MPHVTRPKHERDFVKLYLDDSIESYRTFLKIKALPRYEIHGRMAVVPDEYAATLGVKGQEHEGSDYLPRAGLFDYQRDIVRMAVQKRKFAIFADCGLGKTLMLLEFARHVRAVQDKPVLIVSPLMVVKQTMEEAAKFYGDSLPIEQVSAKDLPKWLKKPGGRLGITNYDALRDDTPNGDLGGLILDESSMLKSHYGKWGQVCLRLGAGVPWKLALTGTPAPNDRIEYANHAVFLDAFPNVNSFLARFFINRGQTNERWELKPHALRPFYRALSHWCIFLTDPSTYGWKDNVHSIPPIHVCIEDVRLSAEQERQVQQTTGQLFVTELGGITTRSKLSRMAKCESSTKPQFIADMVREWPTESTIIWCRYNDEQRAIENVLPDSASIDGNTPLEERQRIVDDFKAGRVRVLITKPKILGFGLNLQVCTRQVFSGLQDSYEEYYQAVKRSNRIGSTKPLMVHIPVSDVERPMVENVLRKARRVEADTREQEAMFRDAAE